MSYDTIVHEAIEPPSPRIGEDERDGRRYAQALRWMRSARKSLVATTVTICALFLMTWVVAALTPPDAIERAGEADQKRKAIESQRAAEAAE